MTFDPCQQLPFALALSLSLSLCRSSSPLILCYNDHVSLLIDSLRNVRIQRVQVDETARRHCSCVLSSRGNARCVHDTPSQPLFSCTVDKISTIGPTDRSSRWLPLCRGSSSIPTMAQHERQTRRIYRHCVLERIRQATIAC
jgi:hypothetical protein